MNKKIIESHGTYEAFTGKPAPRYNLFGGSAVIQSHATSVSGGWLTSECFVCGGAFYDLFVHRHVLNCIRLYNFILNVTQMLKNKDWPTVN